MARVYIENPDAVPLHDCEDCGYAVPLRSGYWGGAVRRYFDACPLCSGRTGYAAYFHKRGRPSESEGGR